MATDIRYEEITEDRYESMVAWCSDHFGRPALWPKQLEIADSPTTWYTTKAFDRTNGIMNETGRARFSFKTDKEATMFSLRWGDNAS